MYATADGRIGAKKEFLEIVSLWSRNSTAKECAPGADTGSRRIIMLASHDG